MTASFLAKNIMNDFMSIESEKVGSVLCFGRFEKEIKYYNKIKILHLFILVPTEEPFRHHCLENFSTKELSLPSMKYFENYEWHTNEYGKDDYISFLKK